MNQYGLPKKKLDEIRKRDTKCVYCHKKMFDPSDGDFCGDWATIEHLNHLPPWDNPTTVAICCGSCNSSRGKKKLPDWFESEYCEERNINVQTVAEPAKEYLRNNK